MLIQSKIEHTILEVVSTHPVAPESLSGSHDVFLRRASARCRCVIYSHQQFMDIAAPSLACQIRVVRWAHQTDGLRRTREEVADIVRHLLDVVRTKLVLVVHNEVMCWSAIG